MRQTKEALGWDPDAHFDVPDGVARALRASVARGARAAGRVGRSASPPGATGDAELAAEWDAAWAGQAAAGLRATRSPDFDSGKDKLATRVAGSEAMAAFAPFVADDGRRRRRPQRARPTRSSGRRERALHASARPAATSTSASASTGWAAPSTAWPRTAGSCGPYGSTFLQFADYMRGSIRLSALMSLDVVWIFTHDSVGARRGRPDAPAGRAPRGAARDPAADGDPPGRRGTRPPRPGA